MNPTLAKMLVSIYPRPWRKRYGAEFEALLLSGPGGLRTSTNVLMSALHERIYPTPGLAMNTEASNQAHRFSKIELMFVRAPWAMFSLIPLIVLALAYFLACFILWSGWRIFLPQSNTPFVPIDGLSVFYFGVGRMLYYAAPVLIGWGLAIIAAGLRLRMLWPMVGLILIAMIGGTAQVYANRSPGEGGHVSMGLGFAHFGLFHPLAILALTVVPYVVLKLTSRNSASA